MKRRLLAFVLSMSLSISGIAIPVSAEEYDLAIEYDLTSEEILELDESVFADDPATEEFIIEPEKNDDIYSDYEANVEIEMGDNLLFEASGNNAPGQNEDEDLFSEDGAEVLEADAYPESAHPYESDTDQSWTYTLPGAEGLRIHFSSETEVEYGYDYIYIYQGTDTYGKKIGEYSGTTLSDRDVVVPGESVCIQLISDSIENFYGFAIDSIVEETDIEIPDDGYNDGYDDGNDDGYDDGNDDGYDDGNDDGYDDGNDDGYDDGNDDGYDDGDDDDYGDDVDDLPGEEEQESVPYLQVDSVEIDMDEECLIVNYCSDNTCIVNGEILEDDTEDLIFIGFEWGDPGENEVKIPLDSGCVIPEYFVLKAYIIDEETGTESAVFENVYYTKAISDLRDISIDEFEEEKAVVLGNNDFGVFSEDTIILSGNGSVNRMDYTYADQDIYTIYNTDSTASALQDGSSLAYYYNDELTMVTCIGSILERTDDYVRFNTGDIALEKIFDYLKVDTSDDDIQVSIIENTETDGLTYLGETRPDLEEDDDFTGDSSEGEFEYSAETLEASEVKTTLSCSQTYSVDKKLGNNLEISGKIYFQADVPLEIYVSSGRSYFNYGVSGTLEGNLTCTGQWEGKLPLSKMVCPLANGLFYLDFIPYISVSFSGEGSLLTTSNFGIDATADFSGPRVKRTYADFGKFQVKAEGSFFIGALLESQLYIIPHKSLLEFDIKIGPKISAAYTKALSPELIRAGEHSCQNCIDGDGKLIMEFSSAITAFNSPISSSTEFSLKGLDFYYSFDHKQGGRGECPFVKKSENEDNTGDDSGGDNVSGGGSEAEEDDSLEEFYDYEDVEFKYRGYWFRGATDGTCTLTEISSDEIASIPGRPRKGVYVKDPETGERKLVGYVYYNTKRIAGYAGKSSTKVVYIPGGVEEIEDYAFRGCWGLRDVRFPSTLKTIGTEAFAECKNLRSVILPSGVKTIGAGAFSECSSLMSLSIPDSVNSIGRGSFYHCRNIRNLTMPGHLYDDVGGSYYDSIGQKLKSVSLTGNYTELKSNAFYGCAELTSVRLPMSVTIIGGGAFWGCSSLSNITIPGRVTRIDGGAFGSCINLRNITIPSSVTSIGDRVFEGCSRLLNITIPSSVTSIGEETFKECINLISAELSDGITSIEEGTFDGCYNLQKVSIPKRVTSIGAEAFNGCYNLQKMVIPDSVTDIGEFAFSGCKNLISVKLSNSLTRIEYGTFGYCGLSEITIPESVTNIGGSAFAGCPLREVNLTDGLKFIEGQAFANCNNLKSILIPESVEEIDSWAFKFTENLETIVLAGNKTILPIDKNRPGETSNNWIVYEGKTDGTLCVIHIGMDLKTVTIPRSVYGIEVSEIGDHAGFRATFTNITLPGSIRKIGSWAFYETNLKNLILPNGVAKIDEYAFYNSKIESITIPDSVISIGNGAFVYSNLKSVDLPKGVTYLGEGAFSGCRNLERVTLPKNVTFSLTNYTNDYFGECNKLMIYHEREDGTYSVYCRNKELSNIVIPGTVNGKKVTCIENRAFYYNSTITSITIPNSVTEIGESAFASCENLRTVVLPSGLKSIGSLAFSYCTKLTSIEINGTTVVIGERAFDRCSSLETVKMGSGVTDIGAQAFGYCNSLKNVQMSSSLKSIGEYAFTGCSSLISIEIPGTTSVISNNAFEYCNHLETVKMGTGVTNIGKKAFQYCVKLKNLQMPSSLKNIGEYAFAGCGMENLVFPNGLKSIGEMAFYSCSSLICVEIPESVESIALSAFPCRTDFTIKGKANTYAESYAATLGWCKFVAIGEVTLAKPSISKLENTATGIKVTWGKITGAAKYRVYRKTGTGSWTKLADTTAVNYTDTTAKSGTTYAYTVRCISADGKSYTSAYNTTGKSIIYLANTKVSALANTAAGVKITWNKVAGAKGYYVYRKTGSGSYAKIATISNGSTVTYEDKTSLTNGATYGYAVRAYNGSVQATYTGLSLIRLGRPTIASCSNTAKGQVTVKWNKNAKATGYQVQYVLGSTKKTVTVRSSATVSYVIKSLTKGQTYKVYVRSYRTSGGKNYYSAWSGAKSVKITK